jgi:hypothetical protein
MLTGIIICVGIAAGVGGIFLYGQHKTKEVVQDPCEFDLLNEEAFDFQQKAGDEILDSIDIDNIAEVIKDIDDATEQS